ncbi:MAG: hypothetical protein A3D31_08695 [Candidatus Fluviicola riflensis]|nr:MAG: hypothetical protein CHH17_06300 [Candidatus Fluviicola riflensis]OGS80015.1 MAG: hypothetical protein A3D31_08695 [Candidatus Fluviicola riflensis]OGS82530.1 MAG: hypothetical protein A2724_17640 [Fluviicola sp. RIFCSPHIGHO2_01_FULL_43_53]OGS88194.1 MAG: hypothetical protein A3E30_15075 [Fluviicola sp. RIFCSPHIGHO2_12_FULL_43_24]
MKHLLFLTTLLYSIASFAQPDASYYGRYVDETGRSGFDFAPSEQTEGKCFFVAQNIFGETGDLLFSAGGYGSCTKTNKSFTVDMIESEGAPFMMDFFLDKKKQPSMKLHTSGAADQVYHMTLNYEALQAWYIENTPIDTYYDEEDYADEEYTDGEETELTEEEFVMPMTYSRADGSAISILAAGDGTSFFAIVGADYEDCEGNNMLEGILKPGVSETQLFAETEDGCTFVTVVVSEKSVTVTEKKCASVDRSTCKTLSGVYNISE